MSVRLGPVHDKSVGERCLKAGGRCWERRQDEGVGCRRVDHGNRNS